MDEYLCKLPINTLPGIGHALEDKLKKRNIWTCGQLRMMSKVLSFELRQALYNIIEYKLKQNFSQLMQQSKYIGLVNLQ